MGLEQAAGAVPEMFPERQNIGQIMRQVGMTYYSEFPLLLYCSGRCCMDDFWLEEITDKYI